MEINLLFCVTDKFTTRQMYNEIKVIYFTLSSNTNDLLLD